MSKTNVELLRQMLLNVPFNNVASEVQKSVATNELIADVVALCRQLHEKLVNVISTEEQHPQHQRLNEQHTATLLELITNLTETLTIHDDALQRGVHPTQHALLLTTQSQRHSTTSPQLTSSTSKMSGENFSIVLPDTQTSKTKQTKSQNNSTLKKKQTKKKTSSSHNQSHIQSPSIATSDPSSPSSSTSLRSSASHLSHFSEKKDTTDEEFVMLARRERPPHVNANVNANTNTNNNNIATSINKTTSTLPTPTTTSGGNPFATLLLNASSTTPQITPNTQTLLPIQQQQQQPQHFISSPLVSPVVHLSSVTPPISTLTPIPSPSSSTTFFFTSPQSQSSPSLTTLSPTPAFVSTPATTIATTTLTTTPIALSPVRFNPTLVTELILDFLF
jgi:hypothetical protein